MTDLLSSLSSWVSVFINMVTGTGTVGSNSIGFLRFLFIPGIYPETSPYYNIQMATAYFMILLVVSPVVIFAIVGIWHRLLRKN